VSDGEGLPQIAGYDHLVEIGSGGTAKVYSANHIAVPRPVAIKVIDAVGPQARRFTRELRALGMLSDIPHVVPLYSIESTSDGRPAIVMPLMKDSLAGVARRRGACSLELLVKWTGQLAVAIDQAHQRGIVHRDIKPENVLISSFDDACLADFGIADITDMGAATMTRMQLTPAYAPPEQLSGTNSGSEAGDIYSLAATIYATLAGHPPFGTSTNGGVVGLANRIADDPVPSISGVPSEIELVLRVGLSKEPADRPSTAGQFATALALAVSHEGRHRDPTTTRMGSDPTARMGSDPTASMGSDPTARMGDQEATSTFDGAVLMAGVFLTEVEALMGGVHSIRVADPNEELAGTRTVQVRIPSGARAGQRLLLQSERSPGDPASSPVDVNLLVQVEGQCPFTRQGANLAVTVPVDEGPMVRGTQVRVPTLDGATVTIKVPPGTAPGQTFRIRGGGTASAFGQGDLLVTVVASEGDPHHATARTGPANALGWRIRNSLWTVPTLLFGAGFFAWAGYLYIGKKAGRRAWIRLAAGFAAADVALVLGSMTATALLGESAGAAVLGLGVAIIWSCAVVLTWRTNREWLLWKAT
jgi:hypothetical protein